MSQSSFFLGADIQYLSYLYEKFLKDPSSISPSIIKEFQTLEGEGAEFIEKAPSWTPVFKVDLQNTLEEELAQKVDKRSSSLPEKTSNQSAQKERMSGGRLEASLKAAGLMDSFRQWGHMAVQLDPLGLSAPLGHPQLSLEYHGIQADEMDQEVSLPFFNGQKLLMKDVIQWCKNTYSSRVGYEFAHITRHDRRQWLQKKIEEGSKGSAILPDDRVQILRGLMKADIFERFLAMKFPGAKRFGLEGGDSMIPLLEAVLQYGAKGGKLQEVVIGMAHRGRLNVLTNVMNKPYAAVLNEFKKGMPVHRELSSAGDVKYHMGASTDRLIAGQPIHLSLMPNPSHLEAVNPVAMGKVRARQDELKNKEAVMCCLVHGDAAFAGQGVVAECLAMSELAGFSIGGTFHIIINNQIGFTTNPACSRYTNYCSDVAKGFDIPVFHVNGDDPEAVIMAGLVAAEYRDVFKSDVIIDLVCYRRHGHNEGDEPIFTQPYMYEKIASHPTPAQCYADALMQKELISQSEIDQMKSDFEGVLKEAFALSESSHSSEPDWLQGRWSFIQAFDDQAQPKTGVDIDRLREIGAQIYTTPSGFNLHPKIVRQMEHKAQLLSSGEGLDWSLGEALAFATLVADGHKVRLTGQDSQRGTFSHRHATLTDQKNESTRTPIQFLNDDHRLFEVTNSFLSEAAVLGYEYGYAYNSPQALVLWEAQFGDFANGAQVYMDQFISAGESKWLRKSGVVLLLPHGFEGQGPEHSSARLERYLQLCAHDNMRVISCTTPSNFFHALRRQIYSQTRKPLIAMTPKSLLRHKMAVSALKDFGSDQTFKPIIEDSQSATEKRVNRLVCCSGKVYYDLKATLEEQKRDDVGLIRFEQLYPFPFEQMKGLLQKYAKSEVVWCQEEPENMGAWGFVRPYFESLLSQLKSVASLQYAGRAAEASPAVGSDKVHHIEQKRLIEEALGGRL